MEGELAKVTTTGAAARGFSYPLAVSGIIVVSLVCWFYRIEFYPFTSWHLYARLDTSGEVEYLKVFAQRESGVWSRARFEDTSARSLGTPATHHTLTIALGERPSDGETCKKFLMRPPPPTTEKYARSWRESDAIRDPGLELGFPFLSFRPQLWEVDRPFHL